MSLIRKSLIYGEGYLSLPKIIAAVESISDSQWDANRVLYELEEGSLAPFIYADFSDGLELDPGSSTPLKGSGFQRVMKPTRVRLSDDGSALLIDLPMVEGDAWAYSDGPDAPPTLRKQVKWHVSQRGCEVYVSQFQLKVFLGLRRQKAQTSLNKNSATDYNVPGSYISAAECDDIENLSSANCIDQKDFVPKGREQENAILSEIKRLGYSPENLPNASKRGGPGVKALVRKELTKKLRLFISTESFDKAWERLRKQKAIGGGRNAPPPLKKGTEGSL